MTGAVVEYHSFEGLEKTPLDTNNVYTGTVVLDNKRLKKSWTRIVLSKYGFY